MKTIQIVTLILSAFCVILSITCCYLVTENTKILQEQERRYRFETFIKPKM